MGSRLHALSLSALALLATPVLHAQAPAQALRHAAALAPAYGDDYGYWRQQVRVASPQRRARWNAPPPGAVRVYHRRFDARWNWRSAPRHRVVYTYYRGELWFLDPTTGWAWSIDRYGIVYSADPYRGWVYSLGPLTRWTADLLYFFDLYRFDRGYWYCRDYDYFVDLWEGPARYGYYSYDTAYSTLWDWEPYWRSSTFISYSNRFTTVWVGQVRRHYDYLEHNPHYRREMLDSIGLPAVQAAPPRWVSPRAVATSAYWEARDLAAAGLAPPPRGRDTGRGWEAGTVVDTREAPARVVDPGAPAPGFNAPFPDGTYGFGVRPGGGEPPGAQPGRGRDDGRVTEPGLQPGPQAPGRDGRGRDDGRFQPPVEQRPPQFEEPAPTPRDQRPRFDPPTQPQKEPERLREQPRFDPPSQPQKEPEYRVREEPRFEQPRFDPPSQPQKEPEYRMREEPRFEQPRFDPPSQPQKEPEYRMREEPRFEVREQPRFEAAPREEPRFEAPRERPRFEAPREEPRFDPPSEPQKEERDEGSARGALGKIGVQDEG